MSILGKSLSEILMRDIMSKFIIYADHMITIYQIVKLMEKGEVGAILVKK
jgi:predicted transcriptional regulator